MKQISKVLAVALVLSAFTATAAAQTTTTLSNVAAFQPTDGSWAYNMSSDRAVDDGVYAYFHGGNIGTSNYWWVDLGQLYDIDHLVLQLPSANPTIGHERLNGATLMAFGDNFSTKVADNWVIEGFRYDPEGLEGGTVNSIVIDNGGLGYSGVRYFQIGGLDPADMLGEPLGVNYMCIGEFKAFAQVPLHDTFIQGVTATATDTYGPHSGVSPDFVLDHSGMTDQRTLLGDPTAQHHPLFGQGLWHTTNDLEATKSITFDLGGVYDLDEMVVWNQHQGNTHDGQRVVKECLIEVSTNGQSWTALADTNSEELGNYTLNNLVEGEGPYPATDLLDLSGITAGHVRITALSSYGADLAYVGLSEVRFYGVEGTSPDPLPGDADNDGVVDANDAKRLAHHWGMSTQAPGMSWWEMGDFNGDNVVDARDAAILAAHWGATSGGESAAAAIPEPGAFVLLLGLLAGAIRRRRVR